jgi:hypothetical protein
MREMTRRAAGNDGECRAARAMRKNPDDETLIIRDIIPVYHKIVNRKFAIIYVVSVN